MLNVRLPSRRLIRILGIRLESLVAAIETIDEVWSEEVSLPSVALYFRLDGVLAIPIDVALPTYGPESARGANGDGVRWVVRVSGDRAPGRRFSFQFEVPVFARR